MGPGWRQRLWLWSCLLSLSGLSRALQLEDLFEFGEPVGDAQLLPGSDSTAELPLNHSVMFFKGTHSTAYINTNGFVAFAKPPDEEQYLGKMPSDFTMIAALMGDLDNSDGQGKVYFREDSSLNVLNRAAEHIRQAFPRDNGIEPTNALIVTWENMAARGTSGMAAKRNTFQLVVATLESSSCAIFLYPNDGLQFLSTLVGQDNQLLEAGFNEGLVSGWFRQTQGTYFHATTDSETSLRELTKGTNSAKNGIWVYEIGSSPFFIGITSGMVSSSPEDEDFTEPPDTILTRQIDGIQNMHSSTIETQTMTTEAVPEYKLGTSTDIPNDHQTGYPETVTITPGYNDAENEVPNHLGREHPTTKTFVSLTSGPEKILQRVPDEPDLKYPQLLDPKNPDRTDTIDPISETFQPRQTIPEPSEPKYSPIGPKYPNPDLVQPRYINVDPVQPDPPSHIRPNHPQIVVVDEDDELDVNVFAYNLETCAHNRNKCSTFADCRDYSNGYCCHCRPGFYGNGKECVAEGKPQRMNGKVNGRVFVGSSQAAVELSNNDLHSYVVANDGRAYVAISNIPESVGSSLLPLSSLGGVMGWAFALEQPGFQNGFSLIGGVFSRQAEVIFQPGNERLTIKQQFKGIDEHNHLVVNTELDGRLPAIPRGSSVQINSYEEIYQYDTNLITSSSSRDYSIASPDGNIQTKSYQWHQSIVFQGCPHGHATRAAPSIQQLSVDQIFVMFDASNHLIRYAMSNKIGSIHSLPEQNPCFTGQHGCDISAACRPGEGLQFTCECTAGFSGDGVSCQDIDECQVQVCGANAACTNHPGTFRCECSTGFVFSSDGKRCIEGVGHVDHCQRGSHDCDVPERAVCHYTGGSSYICSCLQGFVGNGQMCDDVDECQQEHCHQEAMCSNTQGSFTCQCRPGFQGDGLHCSPLSREREETLCEQQIEAHQAAASPGHNFFSFFRQPVVSRYVPQCDEHGAFEPTQCHHSIGQCWCVNANGHEIPNTRTGDGSVPLCIDQTATPAPVGPAPRPDVHPVAPGTHLLFAQSGKIEHVPLNGYSMKKAEAKPLLLIPDRVVIAVAYDCLEKMVYWTDITGPAISKASLTGGTIIPVVTNALQSPEGIAVDHVARLLFWTDSMRDTVEVSKLDGSQRRVLFDTDLVNPRPIVTDSTYGRIYWADWDRDGPKIEMSNMDGTDRSILVKDKLGLPNGLTFDPSNQELCWADAGTRKVECVDSHRQLRKTVVAGIQYPFALVSFGRSLYYTDWRREGVVAVDRLAGEETEEFLPQKRSRLYGITTTSTQCPQVYNYCSNNGGCSHLCLPRPGGFSCRCPDATASGHCVDSNL